MEINTVTAGKGKRFKPTDTYAADMHNYAVLCDQYTALKAVDKALDSLQAHKDQVEAEQREKAKAETLNRNQELVCRTLNEQCNHKANVKKAENL